MLPTLATKQALHMNMTSIPALFHRMWGGWVVRPREVTKATAATTESRSPGLRWGHGSRACFPQNGVLTCLSTGDLCQGSSVPAESPSHGKLHPKDS